MSKQYKKNTLLRLPVVLQRTGLCRSSVYDRMSRKEFPQSVSLGGRAVAWVSSEIDAWIQERIEARQAIAA